MSGLGDILSAVKSVRAEVKATDADLDGMVERVRTPTAEVEQEVVDWHERFKKRMDEAQTSMTTAFDQLRANMADNNFSAAFAEQMAEVEDGSRTVQQLIQDWGEAQVVTEQGVQTVRELLQGIDPDEFRRKAQEIQREADRSAAGLGQTMQQLQGLQSTWSNELLRLIKLWEEGKATLDQVIAKARSIEDSLGHGSQSGALADVLQDQLRDLDRQQRGGR